MKVLQLIDSLNAGGAERVAINLANAMVPRIQGSYLCATRQEGPLRANLNPNVGYFFLKKKGAMDLRAINRFRKYILHNSITIIHAHSSSFFLAVIIKLLYKNIHVVWHDHYGNSDFLDKRKSFVLKHCSMYFDHVVCVNKTLENWARQNLKSKYVSYVPNFAQLDVNPPTTILKGIAGKRILHLANLRPQKDHFTLFKAFSKVIEKHPDWTLHCVGKNLMDAYSYKVKKLKDTLGLTQHVFFYNEAIDVAHILKQSTIAVLSSKSEGLPLALLEYGLAGLPTVVTNVGHCKEVVGTTAGKLIPAQNPTALTQGLVALIEDKALRETLGHNLKEKVTSNFSETAVLNTLQNIYSAL